MQLQDQKVDVAVKQAAFAGLIFTVAFLAWIWMQHPQNEGGVLSLSGIAVLHLLPFLIATAFDRLNFLSVVFLNYLITYTTSKYKVFSGRTGLSPAQINELNEMIICGVLTSLAFYALRTLLLIRKKARWKFLIFRTNERTGMWLILLGVLITFVGSELGPFSSISAILFMLVLIIIFSATAVNERGKRVLLLGRAFFVASLFTNFANSGALGLSIVVFMVLFITVLVRRKASHIVYLAMVTVVLLVMQPIKYGYRMIIQNMDDPPTSQRVQILKDLLGAVYFDDSESLLRLTQLKQDANPSDILDKDRADRLKDLNIFDAGAALSNMGEDELDEMSERFGGLAERSTSNSALLTEGYKRVTDDSLSWVIEGTPSLVPFWEGSTYQGLMFILIPRFLWAGKPVITRGNEFGLKYGVLNEDDEQTSVAYSYLAEGYMNYGYSGLYIVSAVFGIMLASFEYFALVYLPGGYLISFIFFIFPFLTYANDLTVMTQSMAQNLIVALLIRKILLKATQDEYAG